MNHLITLPLLLAVHCTVLFTELILGGVVLKGVEFETATGATIDGEVIAVVGVTPYVGES
jgi:hypothetical protein